LRELRTFRIHSKRIDNRGLAELAAIPALQSLDLIEANIDDQGLEMLKRATNIKDIEFNFTNVTPAGVADLGKSLPDCNIWLGRGWNRESAVGPAARSKTP
jgi:hypothetical protein